MCVGENNRKDGHSTTIFRITERKTSIQVVLRMNDEESQSARKWMWKITLVRCLYCILFMNSAKKAI